ncbi:MAG: hypothetical protein IT319_20180 [Anaerolineae bacterium]|nr:hypothetical protein [Anaerolineae bacterium]
MRKLLVVFILTVLATVPAYAQRETASIPAVTKTTIPSPGTIRGFDPQPDPPHDPFRFMAGDGSV